MLNMCFVQLLLMLSWLETEILFEKAYVEYLNNR